MEKMIELKDGSSRRLLVGATAFMSSVIKEQGPNDTYMIIGNEKVYFKMSFDELKAIIEPLMTEKKAKSRTSSRKRPDPSSSRVVELSEAGKIKDDSSVLQES